MALKNNKALGQHWLKDRGVLDAIADSAMIITDDPEDEQPACLEIGPGLGTLTSSLLRRFKKVIAVEFDEQLAHNLPNSFPGKDLEVVNEDFLKFDLESIGEPYVAVGNIPYYITSPIIEKLIRTRNKPLQIVLLIQREVADRVAALDGRQSILSLEVQNQADVMPGIFVPKELFTPPPKVDSATIILTPREQPRVSDEALALAKVGFKNPRKKLMHNLPYDKEKLRAVFADLNLSENVRPADLTLEDWQGLYDRLKA